MTRRGWLFGAAASGVFASAKHPLIDTHVHLFLSDQKNFPYHPNATYKPPTMSFDDYLQFVRQAGIDHVVVVHPEPYQDDHRELEYVFAHEPSPEFFKGTCLFDPIAKETPARMEALVKKFPGRIVAIRIHEMRAPGKPPLTSGAIHDRDLRASAMKDTWRKAQELGIAVQMHFIPYYAPQIGELAAAFGDVPVILDHLARAGQGTPTEYENVLKLAKLPRVYMKYSGVNYSSKNGFPYSDAKDIVRAAYEAFGPDRMIWGGLGMNMEEFRKASRVFQDMFDFATEDARDKIRGETAKKLFRFS
ncbi:MAG: amidohydrolase [Acidobacteriota bacterium]|nr:amidohydrolase [Acidobacteriota bacterium]